MNRKEISAFLFGCEVSEFMAYADQGEMGTVVVGPDGRKFRYTQDQLEAAVKKIKSKEPAKKTTRRQATTKKKPATKTGPTKKPATGPFKTSGNSK